MISLVTSNKFIWIYGYLVYISYNVVFLLFHALRWNLCRCTSEWRNWGVTTPRWFRRPISVSRYLWVVRPLVRIPLILWAVNEFILWWLYQEAYGCIL